MHDSFRKGVAKQIRSIENAGINTIMVTGDNAITASKIFVPSLSAESVQSVYFTWPSKIDLKNVRNIEVIPRFNPFSSESL